jgi:hypothetical protein
MLRLLVTVLTVQLSDTALSSCSGGWGCGEAPTEGGGGGGGAAWLRRRGCDEMRREDVEAALRGEAALLLSGCDRAFPRFANLSRALQRETLLQRYGEQRTRLAKVFAGVWGPDHDPNPIDNFTLSEYAPNMEAHLPYHAFNAYNTNNAANVIMRAEGMPMNLGGDFLPAPAGGQGGGAAADTLALLQAFEQPIFSLAPRGADMPFHQHYASWLYLAHGRKLWWLAPPEVSPAPALLWNDPWDTLRGWAHELEANTSRPTSVMHDRAQADADADAAGAGAVGPPVMRLMQRPGEVMLLPTQWWHATANVDDCAGVGGHMHTALDGAFSRREAEELAAVSKPFPSFARLVLTGISLCHACSCQEILRAETARQDPRGAQLGSESLARARAAEGHPNAAKHVMELAKLHYGEPGDRPAQLTNKNAPPN